MVTDEAAMAAPATAPPAPAPRRAAPVDAVAALFRRSRSKRASRGCAARRSAICCAPCGRPGEMSMDPHRWRLLPITRVVMAILLVAKFSDLARAAVAAAAEAPPAALSPAAPAAAAATPENGAPAMAAAPPGATAMEAGPGAAGAMPAAPPPRGAMPAAATQQEAPVSQGEASLLLDLRHRRGTLDARSAALDQRDAVMAAAEQKIAARVAELAALQTRLEALESARQQHDAANWSGLVKVYETMKPRDAAAISMRWTCRCCSACWTG